MTKILQSRLKASPLQIAVLCRAHQIRELAVFGSALRDDFTDESDFDLLVTFEPEASIGFLELASARRELATLLGREVDLVPRNGLKPEVRGEILAAAEPLFAI